ncbi:hypothetical protein ACSDGV_18440 [Pseudomonas aeruginosa]|uniref:hypothetical protein n=1 Tax=Pseudomonas aeruginosa TaxID=287 RepID=UPI00053E7E9C|nr:hypothetical protein [Pseudomonas aeruginosa]EKX3793762.1 hypothetical protein [Pseudomonas aeruginosa]EKX8762920.1 hypothetical protein [Pseudomonas aeruginosa]ELP1386012.1 hypothetical protein [Pseudomonas aeruginosa]KAA5680746.1 hypothetical protein F3G60_04055 [Pseudomonas aeruginosa]KSB94396.2 hypothetical protein AO884_28990 [Pseudomonas aeruginosa]
MADKKIDKFWTYMLAAIIGMSFAALAIHLYDRFSGNGTAWSFYNPNTNMTCLVARSRGQEVMACLPGDHQQEASRG